MAHRPRPDHRPTQLTTPHHEHVQQSTALLARQARPKALDFLSESESAEHARSALKTRRQNTVTHADESDDADTDAGSERDEEALDAPRVAQWIDDETLELQEQLEDASDSEETDDNDHSASGAAPSRKLRSLEHDLSTLPLGTLRSAQRSLARAQALSGAESDSEEQSEGIPSAPEEDAPATKSNFAETPDHSSGRKSNLAKRSNKHAPVEVTSKRPVSRRRVVIDDKSPTPRDPRFMHAAGRYDPSKFKQRYEFLSNLRTDELGTLRGHVKRARKLLGNSPAHLKAEREEEVKRLEHAMKKAESAVNLDNRERVEHKALQSAKRTEKEKRKQGKAEWWMKRSEKKELLTKARLGAIASVGGKQAVKKAIEKKRKKISQKERKTRPFPHSQRTKSPDSKRRRPVGSVDLERGIKRRKVVY